MLLKARIVEEQRNKCRIISCKRIYFWNPKNFKETNNFFKGHRSLLIRLVNMSKTAENIYKARSDRICHRRMQPVYNCGARFRCWNVQYKVVLRIWNPILQTCNVMIGRTYFTKHCYSFFSKQWQVSGSGYVEFWIWKHITTRKSQKVYKSLSWGQTLYCVSAV